MAASGEWLGRVARQISRAEGRLAPSERKRLKLELLLRSARRVATLSDECATCRALQGHIEDIAGQLTPPDGRGVPGNLASVAAIARHLRLAHGLVVERHYVTRFLLGGVAFGLSTVAAGLVLVDFGITMLTLGVTLPALAMRVVFSYTIGRWLDWRAKRRGRLL